MWGSGKRGGDQTSSTIFHLFTCRPAQQLWLYLTRFSLYGERIKRRKTQVFFLKRRGLTWLHLLMHQIWDWTQQREREAVQVRGRSSTRLDQQCRPARELWHRRDEGTRTVKSLSCDFTEKKIKSNKRPSMLGEKRLGGTKWARNKLK